MKISRFDKLRFDEGDLPKIRHEDAIQSLVKRPRCEISTPIMIVSVCICEEIAAQRWKIGGSFLRSHSIEILLQSTELGFSIQRWLIVDVIEQFRVVCVLRFPFGVLAVPEVVAQWDENRPGFVQRRFLPPLIEYEFGSGTGEAINFEGLI